MPQIKTNAKGGVIRWDGDDWANGLAPDWGTNGQFTKRSGGMNTASNIDPNRRPGYLLPGFQAGTVTNANASIDATVKNGVAANDNAYLVAGDEVHELDIVTNTITTGGSPFPHQISAHAGDNTVVVEDIVIYYKAGTKYAFYSWNDNADGDVGRYDLNTTFDDDWMSTQPATGAAQLTTTNPHPMIVGGDDILYIGDGNNLASYDGTSDIFSPSAFDLPIGYVIQSFTKTATHLVIYALRSTGGTFNFKTECTAFFWDTASPSFTYSYDLSGNFVNGGFSLNGIPGCFVSGQSFDSLKTSKLLLLENGSFVTKATFEGGVPKHGGVETFDGVIMWNSDGNVYQYGSQHLGLKNSLNQIMGGGGTGILKSFKDAQFILSGDATGDLFRFSGGYNSARAAMALTSPPLQELQQARVSRVKVFYIQTGLTSNTDFYLSLNVDKLGTNHLILDVMDDPGGLVVKYETLQDGTKLTDLQFESIAPVFTWTNAVASNPVGIQAIEVYYTNDNI